jgi:hypothetical protein
MAEIINNTKEFIKSLRINTVISLFLKLLLISVLPLMIIEKQYLMATAAVVAIVLSFIPMILKRRSHISLPWIVDLLITLALYLHMGGVVFKWYQKYPNWDVMMHILGTSVIALLAFMLVFTLYYIGKISLSIGMIGFFTFIFAIGIGGLWELSEFGSDIFLGTNSQLGSLLDTDMDLFWDAFAGLIVAILGMLYAKHTPEDKIKKTISDIIGHKSEIIK